LTSVIPAYYAHGHIVVECNGFNSVDSRTLVGGDAERLALITGRKEKQVRFSSVRFKSFVRHAGSSCSSRSSSLLFVRMVWVSYAAEIKYGQTYPASTWPEHSQSERRCSIW
jgi:hypothetical protein